ncbi:adenylyl cyclase-associated protein 1-like [Oscarella lobularis]|uniref:adenylyl cyclase-associated protein 1-like n=1 Tax=Oscarella lobularis TaxID=121494 RepID=UPI0033139B06
MAADLAKLVSRLESVTTRLENVANRSGGAEESISETSPGSEFLAAFDTLLKEKLGPFVDLTAKIGGDLVEQVQFVKGAFEAQRNFLEIVSKCKEPGPSVLQQLLKPTSEAIVKVQDFKEKRRGHAQFNHFSCVGDGIQALGWVTVVPKPSVFVKEGGESAKFYGNRVKKEFKGKDDNQVKWADTYYALWDSLQEYVKKYHLKKLSWNSSGPIASAGSAAAPAPGPPPPPPPAIVPPGPAADTGAKKPDMSGLFASLNKGSNVTSGLKHVSRDQMTHKNPSLRAASVVKASDAKPAATTGAAAKKPAAQVKKDPVFRLDGKKWAIEYQEKKQGADQLVVDQTNMSQSVYVFRCVDSTIVVKGRVNNVTLDSCKKCAIVVDKCISGIDIINSQRIQAQIMESVPTVNIDKTDGCQVYLSKECRSADIVMAKSSEMNVMIPQDDGDFTEVPLPEQYKSKWNGKTMVTEPTDIAG